MILDSASRTTWNNLIYVDTIHVFHIRISKLSTTTFRYGASFIFRQLILLLPAPNSGICNISVHDRVCKAGHTGKTQKWHNWVLLCCCRTSDVDDRTDLFGKASRWMIGAIWNWAKADNAGMCLAVMYIFLPTSASVEWTQHQRYFNNMPRNGMHWNAGALSWITWCIVYIHVTTEVS